MTNGAEGRAKRQGRGGRRAAVAGLPLGSRRDRRKREKPFRPPDMRGVPLPIVYEHPDFLVVDKPSGLLSIPGRGPHAQDSVIGRVAESHPEAEGSLMVHRLDMDCSGLMLAALNKAVQSELASQFENREVEKHYEALVEGWGLPEHGRIELAFRLDPADRPRQVYDPVDGKLGITTFRRMGDERLSAECLPSSHERRSTSGAAGIAVERDAASAAAGRRPAVTRIHFEPLTGRTHQLRLHASHPNGLGRPIVGDRLYGDPTMATRLMLHARRLRFRDPRSGDWLDFEAPTPF